MAKQESVRKIKWLANPEEQDYPAALSYLNLLYFDQDSSPMVEGLRKAKITEFKAKDIFRASNLPLLAKNNFHVKRDIKKIKEGKKISPVLLVKDPDNSSVIIADGYHRMCAAYHYDEDLLVPCKIV